MGSPLQGEAAPQETGLGEEGVMLWSPRPQLRGEGPGLWFSQVSAAYAGTGLRLSEGQS